VEREAIFSRWGNLDGENLNIHQIREKTLNLEYHALMDCKPQCKSGAG
jgi:hypothetical protein